MDPKRREQLKQFLEQRRRQRAQQQKAAPRQQPAHPKKPKAPRDEHGHCLGQGPDDRPKDINLFHGWLGTKHELGEAGEAWSKAIKPPSPKGSKEWWYWRLTPYPYRYDNHDDHCDRANQPVPLLANIINLAALAFIIVRYGRKPVSEALKNRKRTVMTEFDKAADIKRSARNRLDDYEDQLDNLDERLDSLREQYAAEGRYEEERVRKESAERRERMLADATFRVSQESKALRDELSREALEAALDAAEELIEKSLTKADHDRLAAAYLEELGPALRAETIGSDQSGGTA
jgi:F-type H+-transporting ATPase subunit b